MKLFNNTGILVVMVATVTVSGMKKGDIVCVRGQRTPGIVSRHGEIGMVSSDRPLRGQWNIYFPKEDKTGRYNKTSLVIIGTSQAVSALQDAHVRLEDVNTKLAQGHALLADARQQLTDDHKVLIQANAKAEKEILEYVVDAKEDFSKKAKKETKLLKDTATNAKNSEVAAAKSAAEAEATKKEAVKDHAECIAKMQRVIAEAKRAMATTVLEAKRAMGRSVAGAKAEGDAAVAGIATTVQTRVDALGKECTKQILYGLEESKKFTNSMKMKTDMEFLQTLLYVVCAVVAFLVLILVVAVGYTCVETQSPRQRRRHRREVKPRRKNGDRRPRPEQRPRPKYRPRAHPQPRDGNRS